MNFVKSWLIPGTQDGESSIHCHLISIQKPADMERLLGIEKVVNFLFRTWTNFLLEKIDSDKLERSGCFQKRSILTAFMLHSISCQVQAIVPLTSDAQLSTHLSLKL